MIIYLGMPMYGGAHGLTVSCLLSTQKHLMQKGHTLITDIVADGSILTKVRNGIVKRFIDSKADVLLFVDSDMLWQPEDIEKLINAPFDVSVINYRSKNNAVKWLAVEKGEEVDGWQNVIRAGTGLMAIKRKIIETMIPQYPQYWDRGLLTPCLFDFECVGDQYHGEDYTFCKRVIESGGQIKMLCDAYTGHIGTTVYGGNYKEYLRA